MTEVAPTGNDSTYAHHDASTHDGKKLPDRRNFPLELLTRLGADKGTERN